MEKLEQLTKIELIILYKDAAKTINFWQEMYTQLNDNWIKLKEYINSFADEDSPNAVWQPFDAVAVLQEMQKLEKGINE